MWKAIALAVLVGSVPGENVATPRYAPSLEAARAEAKKSSRPMLVKFYTSWCGWCRKMDRDAFRDPRVIEKADKELIFVSLDAEDGASGSKLARELRVSSYPTVAVLDSNGREIGRIKGYRPADRFVADLDRILGASGALAKLLDAEKANPDDPQVLWEVATSFEREQKNDEARRRYEKLLALKDAKAGRFRDLALWNLAELARREEDRNGALEAYQRLVSEFPDTMHAEDAHFQIARIHQLMGNLDDAISGYEALLRRFPSGRYAGGVKMQLQALRLNYGRD